MTARARAAGGSAFVALAGLLLSIGTVAIAQDFPVEHAVAPTKPVVAPEAVGQSTVMRNAQSAPANTKATPTPTPIPLVTQPGVEESANETAQAFTSDELIGPPVAAELVGPPVPTPTDAEAVADDEALVAQTDGVESTEPKVQVAFKILGEEVAPGQVRELLWKVGESFDGGAVTTPVIVKHGMTPGPRLCLTAAVHGDELNGIEVVRRVINEIKPEELSGTVIGVPIVNLMGFSRGSRYLPDRRDLNRFFPGTNTGSAASRIAYTLFKSVIVNCDALVDFHTGSFDRANLPQVRGDLTLPSVLEFTRGFGAAPVLHSPGSRGMLRLAATDRGIPSVTFEVGLPLRLEPEQIDFAVQSINTLMHKMGMTRSFRMWNEPQATFYESKWVRVDQGGLLFSTVKLGDRVRAGQRLGKVIDPVQNEEHEVLSTLRGRVLGMALNQVVLPGFAAYHIGIETSEQQAAEEASQPLDADAIERLEGEELNNAPGAEGAAGTSADGAPAPDEAARSEPAGDEDGSSRE